MRKKQSIMYRFENILFDLRATIVYYTYRRYTNTEDGTGSRHALAVFKEMLELAKQPCSYLLNSIY